MRGCVSLEEVVFPKECRCDVTVLIFRPQIKTIYLGSRSPTALVMQLPHCIAVVVEHYVDHSSIRMWPTLFLVGWPSPEELARLSLSGVSVIRLTGNSDRGRASKHAVFAIITIIIIITRPYHRIHTFPSRKRNPIIKNASYFFGINCSGAGVMQTLQ